MEENKNKITSFSSKTNNKTVLLVLVEDPSVKVKYRGFLGVPELEMAGSLLSIKGYEISWSDREKINSYQDALIFANKFNNGPEDVVEIKYPWQRVISVNNIGYKRKDLKQENK